MRYAMLATVAAIGLASGAGAATYNVGFENSADPNTGPEDRAGNVSWVDGNKFLYGQLGEFIVLGDDGFTNQITFTADLGTTFTPVSVDLVGGLSLQRSLAVPDPDFPGDTKPNEVWEGVAADFVTVTGYSNGVAVTSQTLTPTGQLTFGSSYEGIDALSFSLLFNNYWAAGSGGALEDDGYYYRCGSGEYPSSSCVSASIDNFVFSDIAAVPLPASAGLLFGGLAGLGFIRRSSRLA